MLVGCAEVASTGGIVGTSILLLCVERRRNNLFGGVQLSASNNFVPLSRGCSSLRHNFMKSIDKSEQLNLFLPFTTFQSSLIPKYQKPQVFIFRSQQTIPSQSHPSENNPFQLSIQSSETDDPTASAGVQPHPVTVHRHPQPPSHPSSICLFRSFYCTDLQLPQHNSRCFNLQISQTTLVLIMRKWQKVICPS